MPVEVWGMIGAGVLALVAGFVVAWPRLRAVGGAEALLLLGPVFEAAALAAFAAEHFTDTGDLMGIVPKWLPFPLFWTYFVGVALLAAAVSFIAFRCVRWSASLLALLFLIIVATMDLPNLLHPHNRFFWILTVRETAFAAGAMVMAGHVWRKESRIAGALIVVGRGIVAAVMIFYGIEHFFFPRNVPGVPLEKLTPQWIPAPTAIAYVVGMTLALAGIGLLNRRTVRFAAAGAGLVLLLLTAFFYVPIAIAEIHTPLAVEGLNYVYDTLLYAATVMLAGLGCDRSTA
jgi:uncharacterized membrane protein